MVGRGDGGLPVAQSRRRVRPADRRTCGSWSVCRSRENPPPPGRKSEGTSTSRTKAGDGGGQGSAPADAAGLLGLAQTGRRANGTPWSPPWSTGRRGQRIRPPARPGLADGSDGGRVERCLRDPSGLHRGRFRCAGGPSWRSLLMAVVAMVLRVLVPSPSRLALDMRLEDDVAVVEPVRLDNPVLVDLKETSLAEELVLYARYLSGRWGPPGRHLARQAGRRPESRFARRAGPVPARDGRAWSRRSGSCCGAACTRAAGRGRRSSPASGATPPWCAPGCVCVWTGLGARRGRVWSSQAGSLALPEEGPDPVDQSGPSVSDRQRRSNHARDGPGPAHGGRGDADRRQLTAMIRMIDDG